MFSCTLVLLWYLLTGSGRCNKCQNSKYRTNCFGWKGERVMRQLTPTSSSLCVKYQTNNEYWKKIFMSEWVEYQIWWISQQPSTNVWQSFRESQMKQGDTTICFLEWLKSETLTASNAGEPTGQQEPSWLIKYEWCSPFGGQSLVA